MKKFEKSWRRILKTMAAGGAPADLVHRFDVLMRPFIRNAERGFWPLHDRGRCDAMFAAAAISKLTGKPVHTIRFVDREEHGGLILAHGLEDYMSGGYLPRLKEAIDGRHFMRLEKLMMMDCGILFRITDALMEINPPGNRINGQQVILFLALAAMAGDRKLFDALDSIAVAMQDMIPLGEDFDDPGIWYVRTGSSGRTGVTALSRQAP